ncbi:MAG: crossover junction endodeoxyribonuclease RuvC [Vicinamibacteria bacterium]|nr:crossover junction endodeoxyribonuclease RuvC [Vicinamibacteria bacterium]
MIILGVDPGSVRTGCGVISAIARDDQRLLHQGILAPSARLALPERLRLIHDGIGEIIVRCKPDVLAVEDVFHAVNTRTALVLGHVRGVVLLAGADAGLMVETYPPATVKQQITGSGRADKAQVAYMVARHLGLPLPVKANDATDALAVALCHAFFRHDGRSAL